MNIATIPHNGTAESIAAAEAARPSSGRWRRMIVQYIADQGADGATDQELAAGVFCDGARIHPDAVRARRGEAWGFGLITDSLGERRRTESGNRARVYHVTAAGLKALGMPADSWCVDRMVMPCK